MYGMSLKAAMRQLTAYFLPSTHPQLLHKTETRPLAAVEHSYGKSGIHSINLSDLL